MSRIAGHHAPRALVGVVLILILLTLFPAFVSWQLLAAMLVIAVMLALSVFAHNRGLCSQCIGSLPLDAPAVATRYSARFRVAHLFERKIVAYGYLGVVVVSSCFALDPAGKYVSAAVQASLAYLLLAYVNHQRLQPWCPFCENGGEELTAPAAPTPVSSAW
jgi:hypothetical protein